MSSNCDHKTCEGPICRREKKKKKLYKIRPFSKKRQKLNREYSTLRKRFLEERPLCEAKLEGCTGVATDVHHVEGRGNNLLNVEKMKAVCRNCHRLITDNSKMAIEKGLSKSRLICKDQKDIIG